MNKVLIILFLIFPSVLQAQKGFFYVKPTFNTKLHVREYGKENLDGFSQKPEFYNNPNLEFKNYNWYNYNLFNNIQIGINLGYKFSNSKTSIEIGYQQDQAISGFKILYNEQYQLQDSTTYHQKNFVSRYGGTTTILIPILIKTQLLDYSNLKLFGRGTSLGCKMNLNLGSGIFFNQIKGIYPQDNIYVFNFTDESNDDYTITSTMYPGTKRSPVFIVGVDLIPKYKNRELLEIGLSYTHSFRTLSGIGVSILKNNVEFYNAHTTSKGSGIKLEFSKRINVSKIFRKEKSE